ncbi:hypothetical protein IWX65_000699 [Arthrobacter sp. CAN_A214]
MDGDFSQGRGCAHDDSKMAIGGCVALSITGALVMLGCVLAIYLESTGLGAPRDAGMRPGYTTMLITIAMAGILVPAAVCFAVLRTAQRLIVRVTALAAVIIAIAIVGIVGP